MNKPEAQSTTTKLFWRMAGITVPVVCILGYLHEPKAFVPVLASVYLANLSGFWHGTVCAEAR